jgi:hypothetical protein
MLVASRRQGKSMTRPLARRATCSMLQVMARVRCQGAALICGFLILALSPTVTAEGSPQSPPDEKREGQFEVVEEKPPTASSHTPAAHASSEAGAAARSEKGASGAALGADGPPAPYYATRYHEVAPEGEYADSDPSALTAFQSELEPYGDFVNEATYGTVWVPDRKVVGGDFAPYVSHGHWALDSAGNWLWQSDLAFGWVVFHYGRWVWVDGLGWAWIPGRRYAPAWVEWRVPQATSDVDYVGWAPAPPSFVWYGGFAYSYGYVPVSSWVYCPSAFAFAWPVAPYVIHDHGHAHDAHRHTRPHAPGAHGRYVNGPSARVAGVPADRMPRTRERPPDAALRLARPQAPVTRVGEASGSDRMRPALVEGRDPSPRAAPQSRSVRAAGAATPARAGSPSARRETVRIGGPRTVGDVRGPVVRTDAPRVGAERGVMWRPALGAPTRVAAPRGPVGPSVPRVNHGINRGWTPAAPMRAAPPRAAPMRVGPAPSSSSWRAAVPMRAAPTRAAPAVRGAPMRAAPLRAAPMRAGPAMRAAPMRAVPMRSGGRGR